MTEAGRWVAKSCTTITVFPPRRAVSRRRITRPIFQIVAAHPRSRGTGRQLARIQIQFRKGIVQARLFGLVSTRFFGRVAWREDTQDAAVGTHANFSRREHLPRSRKPQSIS
jgi:hypothetical protein